MKWFYIIILVLILSIQFISCGIDRGGDSGRGGTGGKYDYTNPKAPKTIASKEIIYFEYNFSTYDLNEDHERRIPYRQQCAFKLHREEDGVRCIGWGGGDTAAIFNFEFVAPIFALDDLQVIIDKHDLAKVNGISIGGIGIPEDNASRLWVKYVSGESIYAEDNRGPILSGDATLDIYDFFLALAKEANKDFMYSEEEFWEIWNMLSGRSESADGKKALNFENYTVDIYEDDELIEHASYYLNGDMIYKTGRDKSFSSYSHFIWRDGTLFGIEKVGTEIEFFPVVYPSCPACYYSVTVTEKMYNDGPFNCPHCETVLEIELDEEEEKIGKYRKKLRKIMD